MKWLIRLALLVPLLATACATSPPPTVDETAAIRQAFDTYIKAAKSKDGASAVSVLAAPTFKFYEDSRQLALTGTEDKVAVLPIGQRMTVYVLRGEIDPAVLRTGTVQDLLKSAVDKGLVEQGFGNLQLGTVAVTGDRAMGQVISEGTPAPFQFPFLREDGRWKLDIEPLLQLMSNGYTEAAKQQGMTVDQLVTQLMDTKYGPAKAAEMRKPLAG